MAEHITKNDLGMEQPLLNRRFVGAPAFDANGEDPFFLPEAELGEEPVDALFVFACGQVERLAVA
ncbi:MAG: hypothetical protein ACFUZC_08125 [Chthoniobacteraceae bacterium]